MTINGIQLSAHRVSYELAFGAIPHGLWVLHKCDTPACVNPDHLFLGTPKDNALDMHFKGRANTIRGDSHPMAKLSDEIVRNIRLESASGISQAKLGLKYRVHPSIISRAINKQNWRGVLS